MAESQAADYLHKLVYFLYQDTRHKTQDTRYKKPVVTLVSVGLAWFGLCCLISQGSAPDCLLQHSVLLL